MGEDSPEVTLQAGLVPGAPRSPHIRLPQNSPEAASLQADALPLLPKGSSLFKRENVPGVWLWNLGSSGRRQECSFWGWSLVTCP